jgi:hypothetical protein
VHDTTTTTTIRYGDPSLEVVGPGGEKVVEGVALHEAITRARSLGFGDEVRFAPPPGAYK